MDQATLWQHIRRGSVVELVDAQGHQIRCQFVGTVVHEGRAHLMLNNEAPRPGEEAFVVMGAIRDEHGVECYQRLEDDDEIQAVINTCISNTFGQLLWEIVNARDVEAEEEDEGDVASEERSVLH
ncbi:MAG: hypothetical protein LBU67_09460 [Oscillospiraceae bacterium]|nr:hypothetical protein [Oscillospiraceae bacterium]